MSITARTPLVRVAAVVGDALRRAGIDAVLTGGACACLHSRGAYQSLDIDFVLRAPGLVAALDAAMASAGFVRSARRYEHPVSRFFVEFLPAREHRHAERLGRFDRHALGEDRVDGETQVAVLLDAAERHDRPAQQVPGRARPSAVAGAIGCGVVERGRRRRTG